MLLNSGYDAAAFHGESQADYATVETLLDDVSRSMAASNLTRKHSRGSNGHRPGSSMRGVVKATSSTSNSPRSSMLGRRKTLMSDAYRRRPILMDQGLTAAGTYGRCDGLQEGPRTSRPVSWHPSSQMAPPALYQSYIVPDMAPFDLPPTPAVYSGYTSPSSAFSPLSQPFTDFQQQQQFQYLDDSSFFPTTTYETSNNLYAPYQPSTLRQESEVQNFSSEGGEVDPEMYSHFDWNNFVANGFASTTAPPTPENFLPIQHPSPSFEISEPTPYTLDDPDDDDEPLIGMGLYDTPEKSPISDPHLDNYRAQMVAQLLGPAYRKHEATGKGLKLEETWNPPASDDGEDDDNDDDNEDEDEDAEGSVADEDVEETAANDVVKKESTTYNASHNFTDVMSYSNHRNSNHGWL